ncbi:PASTA domain-containing protein [Cryobacterium sp. Y50]|uniref:protein kinase domain-containing protein n=1 Tax=Cryobacterium sp. Y50 TaxID=2048286 RepID=UPI000CE51683|nr:PASTA domain-containing protein [Cryobacterium sp. Y50]
MTDASVVGLIAGRYRLGDLLGTGGTASVFSAVEVVSGLPVALKILHPHLSGSIESRAAFFAEARATSEVRHPNVINVLDIGGDDDVRHCDAGDLDSAGEPCDVPQAWIALALASGSSLAEIVERDGPLSVSNALAMARGVLQALIAVHSVGLIHRDVSPANIMVAPEPDGSLSAERVVLLDFGLADVAGRSTVIVSAEMAAPNDVHGEPMGVLGTMNYLSPEQAQGLAVDERGDIYQMGGVLYFALTGRPPFARETVAAVLRAHAQSPPPVPSVVRSGVSRALDGIVVKALLKDRGSRFASAGDMLSAIESLATTGISRTEARTRILTGPALGTADQITSVLAQQLTSATATARGNEPGVRALSRQRQPHPGFAGWLALLLVISCVAGGWVLAAQGQGQPGNDFASQAPVASPSVSPPVAAPVQQAVVPVAASIVVPELESLSLAAAKAVLEAAGLRVGTLTLENSANPGDSVLALAPVAGTRVVSGGAIDLTIASGFNLIPSLPNRSPDGAMTVLQAAGFLTQIDFRANAAAFPGTVVTSEPGEGIVHRLGEIVTIVVSTGPEPTPIHTPEVTPTPTPIPTQTTTPTPTMFTG